jgi:predicted amidophosphoribosyltransferase
MKIDATHDFGRKECPNCGMEIAANENACPICGYVFPACPRGTRALWAAVALLLVAAILLLFF